MKNIKDLGEKVAIQCKTQEEWDFVTKELGYKWTHAKWADYKENSIILSHDSVFGTVLNNTYKVVQASDFMPLSPQDEIKELKARIATLEETLRPKKKIEFVKYLSVFDMELKPKASDPNDFENVELLHINGKYDIIKAWDNKSEHFIFLGHWNDGEK